VVFAGSKVASGSWTQDAARKAITPAERMENILFITEID
jgi:hypothetical protein